jgi:hypothetical protein
MKKNEPENFCHHVKANGCLCRAIPLRDEDYCYFHMLTRDRLRRQRQAARENRPLQVGILEDRDAIQLALGDLANAVLNGAIDSARGYLVLQTLQTAARNSRDELFDLGHEENRFVEFSPEQLDDTDPVAEPMPVSSVATS